MGLESIFYESLIILNGIKEIETLHNNTPFFNPCALLGLQQPLILILLVSLQTFGLNPVF